MSRDYKTRAEFALYIADEIAAMHQTARLTGWTKEEITLVDLAAELRAALAAPVQPPAEGLPELAGLEEYLRSRAKSYRMSGSTKASRPEGDTVQAGFAAAMEARAVQNETWADAVFRLSALPTTNNETKE